MEYREVHVDVARNVPLVQLDPAALMQGRNGTADEPLYLICRSGSRGHQAAEKFVNADLPLAGPANLQGRLAADNVFGRAARYPGTQGMRIAPTGTAAWNTSRGETGVEVAVASDTSDAPFK